MSGTTKPAVTFALGPKPPARVVEHNVFVDGIHKAVIRKEGSANWAIYIADSAQSFSRVLLHNGLPQLYSAKKYVERNAGALLDAPAMRTAGKAPVAILLTDRDIRNTEKLVSRLDARSKTSAVSRALAIAEGITRRLECGDEVLFRRPDGSVEPMFAEGVG